MLHSSACQTMLMICLWCLPVPVLKTVPLALPWGSPHEGQTALKRLQTNLPWGVQSRDPSGHADFRVGNKASSPDSEISRSYLKIMWSDAYVFHVFTKHVFLCTSSINFLCFSLRNVLFQSNVCAAAHCSLFSCMTMFQKKSSQCLQYLTLMKRLFFGC